MDGDVYQGCPDQICASGGAVLDLALRPASPEIRQATVEDLDLLVPLFDAYRQFYRQSSDLDGSRRFLLARFEHNQSVLFIAFQEGSAVGFVQLYPSFSSTAMARIFVLNDLFVVPAARRHGTGAALLEKAAEYGRAVGLCDSA